MLTLSMHLGCFPSMLLGQTCRSLYSPLKQDNPKAVFLSLPGLGLRRGSLYNNLMLKNNVGMEIKTLVGM